MANIESIKNEEPGLSVRTKLNAAIVEANKVGNKLDSDDYTATDIKAKYESNPDTNAFTDASLAKLNSIDPSSYATAEQGALADTAVQPGALSTVATTGVYGDLSGRPTLGTMSVQDAASYTPTADLGSAAFTDSEAYATAEQGSKADSAAQAVGFTTIARVAEYPAVEDPNTLYILVPA